MHAHICVVWGGGHVCEGEDDRLAHGVFIGRGECGTSARVDSGVCVMVPSNGVAHPNIGNRRC